jgi:hypothetical protein
MFMYQLRWQQAYRTPSRTLSQLEKYNFSREREEKSLAGAMQSRQKTNDTSPLSRPF